jgi:circadian clock protein KaiB
VTTPRRPSIGDRLRQAADAAAQRYDFRLYISGLTPRSTRAVETVRRICDEHLAGRYSLEIIDVYQQPASARRDQIVATPTLVRRLPAPVRRFIGELADADRLLERLGVVSTT